MNKLTFSLFAVLFLSNIVHAKTFQDDWKYYGGASPTSKDDIVDMFYSHQSVEIMQNSNVKVWVKGISRKDILKYEKKKMSNDSIVNMKKRK